MFKIPKIMWVIMLFAAFCQVGAFIESARAQKTAADPTKRDKVSIGENDVKDLLTLIDTDKNGKISKQEFMKFMEAEFDRLDTDKSGELDPKELTKSLVRPSRGAVGK
jgi:hypothetical protein